MKRKQEYEKMRGNIKNEIEMGKDNRSMNMKQKYDQ